MENQTHGKTAKDNDNQTKTQTTKQRITKDKDGLQPARQLIMET